MDRSRICLGQTDNTPYYTKRQFESDDIRRPRGEKFKTVC